MKIFKGTKICDVIRISYPMGFSHVNEMLLTMGVILNNWLG
jgi:hypothetical protein